MRALITVRHDDDVTSNAGINVIDRVRGDNRSHGSLLRRSAVLRENKNVGWLSYVGEHTNLTSETHFGFRSFLIIPRASNVSAQIGYDSQESADYAVLACEARQAKLADIPKTPFRPNGSRDFREIVAEILADCLT